MMYVVHIEHGDCVQLLMRKSFVMNRTHAGEKESVFNHGINLTMFTLSNCYHGHTM